MNDMLQATMPDSVKEVLQDYDTVLPVPIAWGDMDAFRHVNNVLYFRYTESARIAFFESLAITRDGSLGKIGPILAGTSCRFKFPLTYPDTAWVGTRVISLERDRFLMENIVVSEKQGKVAAVGDALVVSYDYERGRKADIPDEWRVKLEKRLASRQG